MPSPIVDLHGNPMPASHTSTDYEGASTSRRFGSWGLGVAGPTASLSYSLNSLRSRSRKLVINEPQIDGGLDTLVANLIGTGITPRWQIKDPELKAQIQELWADWVKEADADGRTDFYGLQSLAARSMIESGEVLSRFRPRRLSDGLAVPLQLQLLESDHLDEAYTTVADNGNEIRCGIEFSRLGRRTAYHLYREHPSEQFLMGDPTARVPVPASEVTHVYRPLRPGQIRGRPWLSSVILAMHELSKYDDAEQVRKTAAAMFGGFITESGLDPNGGLPGVPSQTNGDNQEITPLEPGTFVPLPPGKDVKFSEPADVGGNYEAFTKRQEHRIARGFGNLTYEKFTGDLSDANYSSMRAGNLEFQRVCTMIINNVLVPQFCQPVAAYFLRQAVLAGKLSLPGFVRNSRPYLRIKWCIDGWPWVDPIKDQQAEKTAIRGGLKSRAQVVAERGRDVEEVDQEIAEDNARADDLGLALDTDPRRTAQNGNPAARDQPIGSDDGGGQNTATRHQGANANHHSRPTSRPSPGSPDHAE